MTSTETHIRDLAALMDEKRLRRVCIIGSSGAGKTTFARKLSAASSVPHVELDELMWQPGWRAAPVGLFQEQLQELVSTEKWIIDGNYHERAASTVWPHVELVIWLDVSLPRAMWRVTSRTVSRLVSREELWNGNRQRLRKVFSRSSVMWYTLVNHRRLRRLHQSWMQNPPWSAAHQVRLCARSNSGFMGWQSPRRP